MAYDDNGPDYEGDAWYLNFNSWNVNPDNNDYRANGMSVRCVAEFATCFKLKKKKETIWF